MDIVLLYDSIDLFSAFEVRGAAGAADLATVGSTGATVSLQKLLRLVLAFRLMVLRPWRKNRLTIANERLAC